MTLNNLTLFSPVYASCCQWCIAWKNDEVGQWVKSLGGFWSLCDLNSRLGKFYGLIWEINGDCTEKHQLLVLCPRCDSKRS